MVQSRWTFINENENLVTLLQTISLNWHFCCEQRSSFHAGNFFNFNGTGGIWRRETILDSGNWESTTLAEDMDLSCRAFIKGWKFYYLNDLYSANELPSSFKSFRSQQERWTIGKVRVSLKK